MMLKKPVYWDCKKCGKSYKTNKGLTCSACVECGQHFPSKYQLKKTNVSYLVQSRSALTAIKYTRAK